MQFSFQVVRNILASEPRVTRFKINWEETNPQETVPNPDQNGASTSTNIENENSTPVEVPSFNENSNSWATMECS